MADDNDKVAEARRRFLENCGRFAVVTPPTVALMLSAPGSVRAALAASGGSTTVTSGTTTTLATTLTNTVVVTQTVTGSNGTTTIIATTTQTVTIVQTTTVIGLTPIIG